MLYLGLIFSIIILILNFILLLLLLVRSIGRGTNRLIPNILVILRRYLMYLLSLRLYLLHKYIYK